MDIKIKYFESTENLKLKTSITAIIENKQYYGEELTSQAQLSHAKNNDCVEKLKERIRHSLFERISICFCDELKNQEFNNGK